MKTCVGDKVKICYTQHGKVHIAPFTARVKRVYKESITLDFGPMDCDRVFTSWIRVP